MTLNLALREDLLQEALLHLWRMKTRRPGQTRSWYVQSCRFHLTHYLASGCSVDSIKRGRGHSRYDEVSEEPDGFPEMVESQNSVLSQVIAGDLISVLAPNLRPGELAVLHSLADGLGAREIGRRLKMSHTMVLRCRAKIKSLLVRLERHAILSQRLGHARRTGNRNQANGFRHPDQGRAAGPVKWPMVQKEPSHTNGTTRPRVIPAGTIPPGQANGLLRLPGS
jgi:DNA-directed RNA polymerase specialized sigma24 family protein